MGGDPKGIIENGYLHSISSCLLFLTIRIGYDIGVGSDLKDLLTLLNDGFGVFAGYFKVLYLLLLSLLVVYVDLEGSLVHGFRLLGSLFEVVGFSEEVLGRVEFLLLYPKGYFLLQGLMYLVKGFLLFSLRL